MDDIAIYFLSRLAAGRLDHRVTAISLAAMSKDEKEEADCEKHEKEKPKNVCAAVNRIWAERQ